MFVLPDSSRKWKPVNLCDEEIGETKCFRYLTPHGNISDPYYGRLVYLHATPFTKRTVSDAEVPDNELFWYLFCYKHDPNMTKEEYIKMERKFHKTMEAVQTPEQLADIVRKSHREVEEEENRAQGTSSSTGADSQVQVEKSKKNDFSHLGLDMSDEEEDEGNVEAANKDPSIDDDMEKCLKGLELSDEEEDEEEEGSENVDGKQARKEWIKKQKADLIEKIARAIHKNIMLTKREKEVKSFLREKNPLAYIYIIDR